VLLDGHVSRTANAAEGWQLEDGLLVVHVAGGLDIQVLVRVLLALVVRVFLTGDRGQNVREEGDMRTFFGQQASCSFEHAQHGPRPQLCQCSRKGGCHPKPLLACRAVPPLARWCGHAARSGHRGCIKAGRRGGDSRWGPTA
jgi:hypothetical protein